MSRQLRGARPLFAWLTPYALLWEHSVSAFARSVRPSLARSLVRSVGRSVVPSVGRSNQPTGGRTVRHMLSLTVGSRATLRSWLDCMYNDCVGPCVGWLADWQVRSPVCPSVPPPVSIGTRTLAHSLSQCPSNTDSECENEGLFLRPLDTL